MPINATQLAGLFAFTPPILAAGAAFMRAERHHKRERGGWAAVTVMFTLFAIEVVAMIRHRVDDAIRGWLRAAGVYFERRPMQTAVLASILILATLLNYGLVRLAPTRRLAVAATATAMVVSLFVVESVSLHDIDAILYRPTGPILLIGWVWLAGGWTAAAAAGNPADR